MTFIADETGHQPQEQLTDRQSELPSQIDKIVPSDHIPVQLQRIKVKKQTPASHRGKPIVHVPKKR